MRGELNGGKGQPPTVSERSRAAKLLAGLLAAPEERGIPGEALAELEAAMARLKAAAADGPEDSGEGGEA